MNVKIVEDLFDEEKQLRCGEIIKGCLRYHYTDIDAVMSILGSQSLWLTHYSQQNDLSEGKFILEGLRLSIEDFDKHYEALTKNLYIASLCLYGNKLSLWKTYGKVNIGFDYDTMKYGKREIADENGCHRLTSGLEFTDCDYLSPDGTGYSQIASIAEQKLRELHSNSPIQSLQYTYLYVSSLCFGVKHFSFHEEIESRIFAFLWDVKPFKNEKKTYIKYLFEPINVKRIVVGPSSRQDENLRKIEDLIKKSDIYKHVEICRSEIPFRDNKMQ